MTVPRKTRYLRYSAELVVVFLGVFLGLLAENYRESVRERADERVSLDGLILDLDVDREDMRGNLQRTESGLLSAPWLLEHADARSIDHDSLAHHVAQFQQTSVFNPNTSEYTALKSAGRINILQDSGFRQRLTKLYESYSYIHGQHAKSHDQVVVALGFIARYVRTDFVADDPFPEIRIIEDPRLVLSEPSFLLAVSRSVVSRRVLVSAYKDGLEDIAFLQAQARISLGRD